MIRSSPPLTRCPSRPRSGREAGGRDLERGGDGSLNSRLCRTINLAEFSNAAGRNSIRKLLTTNRGQPSPAPRKCCHRIQRLAAYLPGSSYGGGGRSAAFYRRVRRGGIDARLQTCGVEGPKRQICYQALATRPLTKGLPNSEGDGYLSQSAGAEHAGQHGNSELAECRLASASKEHADSIECDFTFLFWHDEHAAFVANVATSESTVRRCP